MKRILIFITSVLVLSAIISGALIFIERQNRPEDMRLLLKEHSALTKEYKALSRINEELEQGREEYERQINRLEWENEAYRDFVENKLIMGDYDGLKVCFLTFDDGPSETTTRILDILSAYNAKATFFTIGLYKDDDFSRKTMRRIVQEGHSIGNHTYSHQYQKIYASKEAFLSDFLKQEERIEKITGVKTQLMRFPGGTNNTVSLRANDGEIMKVLSQEMTSLGYNYVDWEISSGDAAGFILTKDAIVRNVLKQMEYYDVGVVLMHDVYTNYSTAEALPEIIETLRAKGYLFLPIKKEYKLVLYTPSARS